MACLEERNIPRIVTGIEMKRSPGMVVEGCFPLWWVLGVVEAWLVG